MEICETPRDYVSNSGSRTHNWDQKLEAWTLFKALYKSSALPGTADPGEVSTKSETVVYGNTYTTIKVKNVHFLVLKISFLWVLCKTFSWFWGSKNKIDRRQNRGPRLKTLSEWILFVTEVCKITMFLQVFFFKNEIGRVAFNGPKLNTLTCRCCKTKHDY